MASNSLSYVGLARRAGKVLAGTAACEKGIKKGKVKLLLLDEGLSGQSKDKFTNICDKYGIDVLTVTGYDVLGPAIGRPGIMVAGITDEGFADAIKNIVGG